MVFITTNNNQEFLCELCGENCHCTTIHVNIKETKGFNLVNSTKFASKSWLNNYKKGQENLLDKLQMVFPKAKKIEIKPLKAETFKFSEIGKLRKWKIKLR